MNLGHKGFSGNARQRRREARRELRRMRELLPTAQVKPVVPGRHSYFVPDDKETLKKLGLKK
jgi:hypothetical protein